jgi:hypothetical protein
MVSSQELNELIASQNIDALNSIYWELPIEYQRIVDRKTALHWNKEVAELSAL